MFRNRRSLHRIGIVIASIVVTIAIGFQPAFSQAGVGSVITIEPSYTVGALNSVIFDPNAIPNADAYEICYFDSAQTAIGGRVALNPTGSDAPAADLEDLVVGRIYGCFIRAHYDQSDETVFSDTLFANGETLLHNLGAMSSVQSLHSTDDAADSHSGARAHNYPNPFNPKDEDTRIVFETDHSGGITLVIYDLFGHLVYEKTDLNVGDLKWGGRNGRAELVASGGYICVLKVGGEIVSQHKIAVIK